MIELTVIDHLKHNLPQLLSVEGAAALIVLEDLPHQLPAAYVLPAGDEAGPSPYATGQHEQSLAEEFVVVFCLDARNSASGASELPELAELKRALHRVLTGQKLPGTGDVLDYAGGQLHGMGAGLLWWRMHWRLPRLITDGEVQ